MKKTIIKSQTAVFEIAWKKFSNYHFFLFLVSMSAFFAPPLEVFAATTLSNGGITTTGNLNIQGALQFTSGAAPGLVLKSIDNMGNATWGTEFDTKTSDDLAEGVLHLYYTDAAVDGRIAIQKGAIDGLASLDGSGKIFPAQLPPLAIAHVFAVADIAARNALPGIVQGDVAVVTDAGLSESRSYIFDGTDWLELKSPLALSLLAANNLSDVGNPATARTNLNLGIADSPTFTGLILSDLTPGSVIFTGMAGTISQDNANFFWDDINKRLGINTTTPGSALEVQGDVKVGNGSLFFLGTKDNPDPLGTNGAMYYNSTTNKLRCFENNAWIDCISTTVTPADSQHTATYKTNETLINIPDGGGQVTLGTISITPAQATGDIYVAAWADVLSSNANDQTLELVIETTSDCTGVTVGNASMNYDIVSTASNAAIRGALRISAIVVDAGAVLQTYSLCAAEIGPFISDTDIENFGMEAVVIDTGSDLAEIYTTNDESTEAGDVVSLDPGLKTGMKKSSGRMDRDVLGIVSTNPGNLIGSVDKEGVKAIPVALSGRVPVKVLTENGHIQPGDYLVPSSVPGVAMKAGNTGTVIGKAIEAYNGKGIGKIMVFVKNFDLDLEKETEQICIKKSNKNKVCINGDQLDKILENIQ